MPGFNINGKGQGVFASPSATAETARLNRWRVVFTVPGLEWLADNITAYAMTCQRPSGETDVVVLHNRQNQIKLPGKYKWNPISVKFYEQMEDTTQASEFFGYWNSVINDNESNTIKADFRGVCDIYMLDGGDQMAWKYRLSNVWPSKVEPTELSYASSEIATCGVVLSYDSAVVENVA